MYAAAVVEPHFQVAAQIEGTRAVLRLTGELDVSSSSTLEDELGRVGEAEILVIDLAELEFIDSTGLGMLVKTHQRLRAEGRALEVVNGGGQVMRLLELTGLDRQLTLISDSDDVPPAQ